MPNRYSILLLVQDDSLREKLASFLESDKFKVTVRPDLDLRGHPAEVAKSILSEGAKVVILDYLAEDATSVKVLQEVSESPERPGFVFVDSRGEADRENIMMAMNEGARAFIPAEIHKLALTTVVTRAVDGPGRLRGEMKAEDELAFQRLDERLSQIQLKLTASQKLVTYLLSTPVSLQPRKVLVLSDSPYQRELIRKNLEDNNFIVTVATSLEEGVKLTLSEKPRIVISDLGLEDGKTGIDFCRELKFVNKFTPCYFVICTASRDKISSVMVPGNGVDDCLLKPATSSDLNEFMSRLAIGLIL